MGILDTTMLPSKRRIADDDIQLIPAQNLDDEFINIIYRSRALDTALSVGVSDSNILVNIQRKFTFNPKV